MRRQCERPGCSAIAEVSYGMDHAALSVWIDDNAVPEREYAGRLCRRHADALVVPRGWTIDDRRESVPKLFRSRGADDSAPLPRSKRQGEHKPHTERPDSPSLFDDVDLEEPGDLVSISDEHVTDIVPDDPESSVVDASDEPADADVDVDPDEGVTADDPDATRAMPWTPRLTGRYSPDETGPVAGRLLGRAFGARKGDQ